MTVNMQMYRKTNKLHFCEIKNPLARPSLVISPQPEQIFYESGHGRGSMFGKGFSFVYVSANEVKQSFPSHLKRAVNIYIGSEKRQGIPTPLTPLPTGLLHKVIYSRYHDTLL